MSYGIVYIFRDPKGADEIYKIGKSRRTAAERLAELNAETSNYQALEMVGDVIVDDMDGVESAVHRRLSAYRIHRRREFFAAPLETVLSVVREVAAGHLVQDNLPAFEGTNDLTIVMKRVIAGSRQRPTEESLIDLALRELEACEDASAGFLAEVRSHPDLSHLEWRDYIASNRARRQDLAHLMGRAAFVKQHWSSVDKTYIKNAAEGISAGALFAIGFPAELVMSDARGRGLFYAMGIDFEWGQYRESPGIRMRLGPTFMHTGRALLTGKRSLDETLTELAFGHALKLDIDLRKGQIDATSISVHWFPTIVTRPISRR